MFTSGALFKKNGSASKKALCRPSNYGQRSHVIESGGKDIRSWLTAHVLFLSMRHGQKPIWRRCAAGRRSGSICMPRCLMVPGKTMTVITVLRCDRIYAPFVFDQPIKATSFTGLDRAAALPHPQTGRHRGAGQSFQPQETSHQGRHSRQKRQASVLAALQSGPETH